MQRVERTLLTVIIAATAWAGGTRAAAQTTRPAGPVNILLIMTDQHNIGVLGFNGNPLVKTPNLDRLAAQGTRFTQAICPTPFCSPTRASIRTGQWPHTHGITFNVAPDPKANKDRPQRRAAADAPRERRRPAKRADRKPGLSDEQVVLDDLLFEKSYAVEHLGKWHLGPLADLHCYKDKGTEDADRVAYAKWLQDQGGSAIDRVARPGETFANDSGGVFLRDAVVRSRDTLASGPAEMTEEVKSVGRSAIAAHAQFETWLADRAIDWMDKHAGGPFMLTYSVSPPHAPWVAPDPFYSMYDPAKIILPPTFSDHPAVYRNTQAVRMGAAAGEAGFREQMRCYYAQVTEMDEQIGRLLARLHQLGLDDKTLVIFTSDHGDMQGAHGMMGKSMHGFYEEIVRVPMIFRFPPTIPAGKALNMQASSVDLMPTMLDYAGQPIPGSVQGRTLRGFLDGKQKPDDAPAFCERGLDGPSALRMIRTTDWKYCAYGDGRRELFYLSADPGEVKNLAQASECKPQREKLEEQLLAWMERTKDPALKTLFGK
jgi:arylsulfatase A-like enzyme